MSYSHDADTAYEIADGFVLARVPKDRLRDRDAWRFFAGVEDGGPVWTPDVARRRPVLTVPGKCYRAGVSYNAALEALSAGPSRAVRRIRDRAGKPDTRFTGGLAIHDAPEPWGPWTTAFSTDDMGRGAGRDVQLPHEVDGRGRDDPPPGLLRRRLLLGPAATLDLGTAPDPEDKNVDMP